MPIPIWSSLKGVAKAMGSITSEVQCGFLAFTGHWQEATPAQCLQRFLPNVPTDYVYIMLLPNIPYYLYL